MSLPPFNGVIVYSKRDPLRRVFRAECKSLGLAEAVLPASEQECLDQLYYLQSALLVVDYDVGAKSAAKVLQAAKSHHNIETRPILLVVDTLDHNVAATAAEFGVSMILTGELTPGIVKERLAKLKEQETSLQPLKEKMIQIAFARERKDLAHSSKLLMELQKQYPGNPRIVVEVAENFIQQDAWEEALKILTPLKDKKPPYLRAIHLMGRCFAKLGQPDAALQAFEMCNLFNPNNVARLVDLGNILLKRNQVPEAKGNYSAALDMDPSNKPAKMGVSQCLLLEGEVNEALSIMKEMSGPRELAAVFNTSAVVAIRHGEFEKGVELYEQAQKALGSNRKLRARIFYNKGIAFHRWQKPDQALAAFETAHKLDPSFDNAGHNIKASQHLLAGGKPTKAAVGQNTSPQAAPEVNWDQEAFMNLFDDQSEDEFDD